MSRDTRRPRGKCDQTGFFHSIYARLAHVFEIRLWSWNSLVPTIESFRRPNFNEGLTRGVLGVEINPSKQRIDVRVGSFDELADFLAHHFNMAYRNSFYQSMNPKKSAEAWWRSLCPEGVLDLGLHNSPPTESDPTGNLVLARLISLFKGRILFAQLAHIPYCALILQRILVKGSTSQSAQN